MATVRPCDQPQRRFDGCSQLHLLGQWAELFVMSCVPKAHREQRGAKVKKKLETDPLHADTIRLIHRLALEGDGASCCDP
jgi:hypothetical protein